MKNALVLLFILQSLVFAQSTIEVSDENGSKAGHCKYRGPKEDETNKVKCQDSIDESVIEKIVNQLVDEDFPELQDVKLVIKYFKSDAYYLATWIKPLHIFKKPSEREYILKINKSLFTCPPPPKALKAIMAHELQHIRDYTHMKAIKLLGLLKDMALSKKKRAKYERATDESVMEMGYARGIKGYRLWIYPLLSPKDLETKKRFYWTPDEVDTWLKNNTDQFPQKQ